MKKLAFTFSILLLLVGCTDENVTDVYPTDVSVSSIVRKNYNTTTNEIISSTTFGISNNKIIKTTGTNYINSQENISNYFYLSNILTNITSTRNGVVTSQNYYIYDSENKLIEYRSESYNALGEIQNSNKHIFTRIQDTIYSNWTRSINNSNQYSPIMSSKIVLDQNKNRTYFEYYDHLNNEFKKVVNTFDANNNILNENYYTLFSSGQYVNTLTNTYTYNSSINTLAYVNNKTYGKEVLMLLYHLQSNAINDINVKSYSTNTINTFNTTFDIDTTFTIINSTNNSNFSTSSEFNTLISNTLFTKFTYDYLFN